MSAPRRSRPGPDGPLPHTPPKLPEPVSAPPAGSAKPAKKKKGRKKLPLLVGGLVVVAGVAYGAGLLMNRSDVPKGTTVLGVDIGGGTRDDAVEKPDKAPDEPEKSAVRSLRVTAVDGKLVDKPDLNALKELYGQTFDGVLITRANGEKTAVTPQDVYGAMRQALKSKTDRVAVIDTDPS
ncbi:hypothetical protein SVIOM342S_00191 [Streptomyces violaceorubidus]